MAASCARCCSAARRAVMSPDRARHQHALGGLQRTQADLDRKLGAILAPAEQLERRPHPTGGRSAKVARDVARMRRALARRDQHLDRAADHLVTRVAEQRLDLTVDERDRAVLADDDHRVGGGLEQRPELEICRMLAAQVIDRAPRLRALGEVEDERDALAAPTLEHHRADEHRHAPTALVKVLLLAQLADPGPAQLVERQRVDAAPLVRGQVPPAHLAGQQLGSRIPDDADQRIVDIEHRAVEAAGEHADQGRAEQLREARLGGRDGVPRVVGVFARQALGHGRPCVRDRERRVIAQALGEANVVLVVRPARIAAHEVRDADDPAAAAQRERDRAGDREPLEQRPIPRLARRRERRGGPGGDHHLAACEGPARQAFVDALPVRRQDAPHGRHQLDVRVIDAAGGLQPLPIFGDGADRAHVAERLAEPARDQVEQAVVIGARLGELVRRVREHAEPRRQAPGVVGGPPRLGDEPRVRDRDGRVVREHAGEREVLRIERRAIGGAVEDQAAEDLVAGAERQGRLACAALDAAPVRRAGELDGAARIEEDSHVLGHEVVELHEVGDCRADRVHRSGECDQVGPG